MAASLVNPLLPKQNHLPSKRATRIPKTIILLQMCHDVQEIRQLHAQLIMSGLIGHPLNAGRLIETCVSACQIDYGLAVFNTTLSPDIFAYNTIIRGLILACSHAKALSEGKQVHGQIIKAGIRSDTHVHSSLIHMYTNSGCLSSAERVLAEFSEENVLAKNSMITGYMNHGDIDTAREMFDTMNIKDTASWSAMITGYTKNGMYGEALLIFREMMASHIPLNESTLVSALSACSHLGALDQGRWIHTYLDKKIVKISVYLGTALVDMYAKCGCIECSYEVFRNMPQKDVVTWGVIISGFAMHGQALKCFKLFQEMVDNGTHPNDVIFVAILTACSFAGHVELGHRYFDQMVHYYGIRPSIEHYGCMVDLLGRAGRLTEAEELISSMLEKPNSAIWGALLNACRIHKDVKRGEHAFKQLTELEPTSGERYKLAAHLFADVGEREDANELRKFVKDTNAEPICGSSFIEVDGMVHEFVVADIDHSRAKDIYRMLQG
ncbi:unnamed protein product [Ilex paraguariensis]|uniref:Uncharacterized protein n=1 Tax=Ilex paraguariensis TaxID=185542 RepID=A0ABC8UI53_9AQUA